VFVNPENYRGTGVIIEKNLVLTNSHILRPGSEILVDGTVAAVVKKSDEYDLALLSVETEKLPKITIDELEAVGEQVFYVGNPGQRKGLVVHSRIVKIDDQFIYSDGFKDIETAMGASGSGLYSRKGHLIGLQKGMLRKEPAHRCLSVSIPGTKIKKFLREAGGDDFFPDGD
jgi:S1-C subfamily serine protease